MKPAKRIAQLAMLLVTLVGVAGIALAASDAATKPLIDVHWTDPAAFSDTKNTPRSSVGHDSPDEWLGQLAKHLKYRAGRALAPGDHLDVTFTDVQRAGRYEPWRGPRWDDVRVIKEIYPPTIDLRFTLTDASGKIVKEGTRELRDTAFLRTSVPNRTDPLRYEKRMLDEWVRTEFAKSDGAQG